MHTEQCASPTYTSVVCAHSTDMRIPLYRTSNNHWVPILVQLAYHSFRGMSFRNVPHIRHDPHGEAAAMLLILLVLLGLKSHGFVFLRVSV